MLRHTLTLAILLGAVPALAQAAETKSDKTQDPNRKICEKIEVTGSRLGSSRVCQTQQQWQDQRRSQREDAERAQQNAGVRQSN